MKYLLIGVLIYFLATRFLKIGSVLKNESKNDPKKDKHGGDYVDYEEIE